jgi:hypothetical protein
MRSEECSTHQRKKKCIRNFVGESKGKWPLSRSRRVLEDIKMNLTEIGLDGVDWCQSASGQTPMAGSCERISEPSGSVRRGREFLDKRREILTS